MKAQPQTKQELTEKLLTLVNEQELFATMLGAPLQSEQQRQEFVDSLEEDPEKSLLLINCLLEKLFEKEKWVEQENEFLVQENKQLSENLTQLERAWIDLNDSRTSFEQSFRQLNEENVTRVHQRTSSLSQELDENQYHLAAATSQSRRLQSELDELNHDYQVLESAWKPLEEEIKKLFQLYNIKNITENKNTMENQQKITQLTEKITTYQTSLQQLNEAAQKILTEKAETEKKLNSALEELATAKGEIDEFTKINAEKDAEAKRVEEGINKANEEADKLLAQIQVMKNLLK